MAPKGPRRSILKKGLNTSKPPENISKSVSIAAINDSSDKYAAEMTFLAPNLKMTVLGPCYVPVPFESPSSEKEKIPTEKMSKCNRNDYRALCKDTQNLVSVLIVGDEVICEDFKVQLERKFKEILPNKDMKCYCSPAPKEDELREIDFFIFLTHLDKLYSIADTHGRMKKVFQHVKYLSYRSLVVGITLSGSTSDRCVSLEDFQNILVEFQIPSLTYSYINRERKSYVISKVVSTIDERTSSSARALISWGLSCPIDLNDTLLD